MTCRTIASALLVTLVGCSGAPPCPGDPGAEHPDSPVCVVDARQFFAKRHAKGAENLGVLFASPDGVILPIPGMDLSNLYLVFVARDFSGLCTYGTCYQKLGKRAVVMRIPPNQVDALRVSLPGAAQSCGMLHRLPTIAFQPFAADPKPVIDVTTMHDTVVQALSSVGIEPIQQTTRELEKLGTRHYESETGKQAPGKLKQWYDALAQSQSTNPLGIPVTVSLKDHPAGPSCGGESSPQQSVVVVVPGNDLAKETLVLGSHIDSVTNGGLGNPAPGGDDDAVGTAINLEVFRVLLEQKVKLQRTLEIHAYAAEEHMRLGSCRIATDYLERTVDVVAMLQMDMALLRQEDPSPTFSLSPDHTSARVTDDLCKLAAAYLKYECDSSSGPAGTSDHMSWAEKGFATAFPFEGKPNKNIHSSRDTMQYLEDSACKDDKPCLDLERARDHAKLGLAFVIHYGGISP